MIRKLRPQRLFKHNNQTPAFERFLVLIIRDLTPKITLDLEKYPLINKTYNPVQRRDINPLSVNIWKSNNIRRCSSCYDPVMVFATIILSYYWIRNEECS
ncbi:unnamed protein product [Rhizophagus irregularis]|nr:unnamed protein product [Rhizophagus irregularis]